MDVENLAHLILLESLYRESLKKARNNHKLLVHMHMPILKVLAVRYWLDFWGKIPKKDKKACLGQKSVT
jgi:hypothetical protein